MEIIRYNALAHRISQMEQDDFQKFMDSENNTDSEKPTIKVDHEAQMRKAKGL